MADSFIQLPADSTGKQLDTVIVNMGVGATQVHREKMVVADPFSTSAFAVVTSSQGLQVSSTQAQSITGTVTVLSASSGLVQISGTATILSASSGLVQISGNPAVSLVTAGGIAINTSSALGVPAYLSVTPTSSVAGASVGPVTSSAGQLTSLSSGTVSLSSQITVTATGPVTVTSGTITLSSVHTVTATGPVTVTSGLISITSGTVTATAATNPWSSAPGFNIPTVSVSSGLNQIAAIQVSPTSSIAGAGLLVITSSFGLVTQSTQPITVTSGIVTLSSVHTVTATGPVTVTSGLISVTSGTITSTAATNPWSSAPTFNLPVVNVSSGLIQISGVPTVLSASSGLVQISGIPAVTSTSVILSTAGITQVYLVSTAGAVGPVTSSFGVLGNLTTGRIVPVLAASSGLVSIDLWQGTSALSPSYVVATSISKVSTAPGSLYALHAYTTAPTGAVIRFYNAGTSSVVMNTSVVAGYLVGAQSTVGMQPIHYSIPPTGWFFSTQCSFDVVLTATSTATVAGTAYVTVGYSTV